ncbi:nuclear transport factor 2 family protein [Streptomyces sp. 891-h]|uniref:nuclear transport factor 2 family protein n=1 Tax=unclassified Streptomyces TaxID=2593676 RepID=UPI001FA9E488|nr:nuclear transport factor 2 family protein [Streptomyces sp. 891-h]UNZ18320.1 SnoaL-like domain-containing protein [Streptomyces sp. 891-h]
MATPDDRTAIHEAVAALGDAWDRADADAYGALFTQDADYVTYVEEPSLIPAAQRK